MVVLVDLESSESSTILRRLRFHRDEVIHHEQCTASCLPPSAEQERPNPNINSFSASLACYPIASNITQYLDLNSLHSLSASCRQFRANLIQFRDQLVLQTLKCKNEVASLSRKISPTQRSRQTPVNQWTGPRHSDAMSNWACSCARDMVGECRKCRDIICRNCTMKPPPFRLLKERHRRLCYTCMRAPLQQLIPLSACQVEGARSPFAFVAISRSFCACEDSVFICQDCGLGLRNTDITYFRGWTWRTRYSTYLGGLGTGIGEGVEGVACGRDFECLGAKEIEKEVDCNAEELAALQREIDKVEWHGRHWPGSSYLAQEIEGIGGVVKKKVKKRIRVGAVVKEYEDERESGDSLGREHRGENRSWCHWCAKIIPSTKDVARLAWWWEETDKPY